MNRSSKTTTIILASKEEVYKVFVGPKALEYWFAPKGMTGKTTGNEDRFVARFIELKAFEKIIQTTDF